MKKNKTEEKDNGKQLKDEEKKTAAPQLNPMMLVTEEEVPLSSNFTLRKILGGDFLTADMMKKQIWVIVIIAAFTLVYVSNRYSCQKDMLEINELNEKLKDAKYRALASSSELTELSRESNVLEMLKNNKDSTLKIANQPPYIITVPKK